MRTAVRIAAEHKPKEGLTISTPVSMQGETNVSYFSLGKGTDITPEMYAGPVIYIGMGGKGRFRIEKSGKFTYSGQMEEGEMLMIPSDTLCGAFTEEGFVYTEIMPERDMNMNENLKAGEIVKLAELLPYETGSIVNMDLISSDTMKFVLMAFDEGTGLSPHRAPGDAIVFALEGKAVIGYEGEEYAIKAGESFRFNKNGLHSVTADGKFKMALLITLSK